MFKLSNVNQAKFGKGILLSAVLFALSLGSAVAKNNNARDDDQSYYNQQNNNRNQGNYGSQVDPNLLLNLLLPTKKPVFDSTDYVDFSKDTLHTPCLKIKNFDASIDGTYYNVKFNQRLKTTASEWFVTSALPEASCSDTTSVNPFTPPSTGNTIRQYQTSSTPPGKTVEQISIVDFKAEAIDIPCLLIKGFSPKIDGSFYHIQLMPQLTIRNISDWKVSAVQEAPECDKSATTLFQ